MTPSVFLINGIVSGGNFPYGVTILKFLARDSANMTSTCDIQVVIAPKPTRFIATSTDTITVCQNDLLDISATNVTNATYRWTYPNGLTTNLQRIQMSSVLLGKSDWLRLTTTVGNCTYTDSVYIKILGLPFAVNDNYQTNTLLRGNVMTNDTLAKGVKYTVTLVSSVGSGTLVLNKDGSFIYNPTTDSTFTVSFVYRICYDNCPSSCSIGIAYIKLVSNQKQIATATNVITPNGDGVNETLVILNFDPNAASNQSEIVIYNQWGDVVYRAAPYRNEWAGTFNNNPLPDATYYFIFKRDPTAKVIKNFVTIIR